MRKNFVVGLAAVIGAMSCTGLSACGGNRFDGGEQIDKTKTTLYVEAGATGVGTSWIDNGVGRRFEEKYEGVSLEPGKTGVQVVVVPASTPNYDNLSSVDTSVFFGEGVPYFTYAAKGAFLDITDLVKSTAEGESVTIESKLDQVHKDGLTVFDGKYYALPHFEIFFSAMYDVDLFEDYNLYYAANGGFVTSKTDKRSAGPDGEFETGDDGMPVTYDEFFDLCDVMVAQGITPFIWSGEAYGYLIKLMSQIAANYGGLEDWSQNFKFNGAAKIITDYETMKEDTVMIDSSNGYLLSQQAGKYQALRFLERMISNPDYYYVDSLLTTYSNVDAQEQFVNSKFENAPIGMIIEGSFWEGEAQAVGIFERSIRDKGEQARNRRFGIMSLPRGNSYEECQGKPSVLTDIGVSYAYINANVKNNEVLLNLSKDFLKFCYTDVSLKEWTKMTSQTKAVNYSLTTDEYNELTEFGQQLWDLKKRSVVAYEISDSDIYLADQNIFIFYERFTSVVKGESFRTPITALSTGTSAKDYFKGMRKTENDWKWGK